MIKDKIRLMKLGIIGRHSKKPQRRVVNLIPYTKKYLAFSIKKDFNTTFFKNLSPVYLINKW